jgi:hypothetical protein
MGLLTMVIWWAGLLVRGYFSLLSLRLSLRQAAG